MSEQDQTTIKEGDGADHPQPPKTPAQPKGGFRARLSSVAAALSPYRLAAGMQALPLPEKRCLGIECSGDEIRAALVRSRAGKIEIVDFMALKLHDAREELPGIAQLQEIRNRLGCRAKTPTVFITPRARVVVLPMNPDRVKKISAHALGEAAKWEAEAYTGIPGHQSLAGVEVEKKREEPGQIQEESDEVLVQVSVLEQNVYRAVKERFRLAGLRMMRIYPAEVCFHVPLLDMHRDTDRAVLEVGDAFSGFALLRGGDTLSINAMDISTPRIREHILGARIPDLEDTLFYHFRQAPPPHSVAVTGTGAMDDRVMDFLKKLSPSGAEPLLMRRAGSLSTLGATESPIFAMAAGGAMRELGKKTMQGIGISDAIPLGIRIRQSIYLMPLAAASLLFALLMSHYLLLRYQENHFRERRQTMEEQIKERRGELNTSRSLQTQIDETRKKKEEMERQLRFMEGDSGREIRELVAFKEKLIHLLPENIMFTEIRQLPGRKKGFEIQGSAVNASSVMEYVLLLRKKDLARTVEVKRLEYQGAGNNSGLSHGFTLMMEIG
ncbi:fimbrial assembly protein PilN [Desulfobotulus alkaliphilus]|uniref:Fimbrial assembly protein PilN n=1 Tax=Desulfobotulus alkaliphilus TaxID=622671 RepID=A0A562S5V2_9BACT|nr:PilN domain-containing protein [Desulfobotulus alkaliphilus]TWI76719.1 fimbrial assembly protein PilN [Desulfobotulus alkaliphilus]